MSESFEWSAMQCWKARPWWDQSSRHKRTCKPIRRSKIRRWIIPAGTPRSESHSWAVNWSIREGRIVLLFYSTWSKSSQGSSQRKPKSTRQLCKFWMHSRALHPLIGRLLAIQISSIRYLQLQSGTVGRQAESSGESAHDSLRFCPGFNAQVTRHFEILHVRDDKSFCMSSCSLWFLVAIFWSDSPYSYFLIDFSNSI